MSRRTPAAPIAVALCLLAAGCGASSHQPPSSGGSASSADSASTGISAAANSTTGASHAGPGAATGTAPPPGARVAAARAARQLPAGVVATVAGQPITLAAYRSAYAAELQALTSSGIPLDPPGFARCAAGLGHLLSRTPALPGLAKPPRPKLPIVAALVADCRARLGAARQGTLTQLIQAEWTRGEARVEGINVSASQLDAALAREQQALGGAAAYARYLARAGETVAQARQRLELGLLDQQLGQRRLGAPVSVTNAQVAAFFAAHHAEFVLPGQPRPKLATYAARIRLVLAEQTRAQRAAAATTAYQRRWRARTVCATGYVVALCANA